MKVPSKPIEAIFFRDWKNAYIPDILEEIYLRSVYKPFVLGKKDLTIVDIGANIGLFSYYAKDYAREVFAIEPASEHQEVLKKMIEFNKIKNIIVCPYAISNTTGTTKFFHSPNTTSHSLSLVADPKDYEEVKTLSFDEFMVQNKIDHIDLLKMDSEGEEGKIFTSDEFKKCHDKITYIVGEYHAWCNMEPRQFANVVTDLGFEVKW